VGTEGDAATAVDADEGLAPFIQVYRFDRAGYGAFTATDAKPFLNDYTAALALGKGTGRTY
jgi:hypothetical protein